MHQFRNGGRIIPKMKEQDIYIMSLEFHQTLLKTVLHTLRPTTSIIALASKLGLIVYLVRATPFGGDDQALTVLAGGQPFADPGLGFFVLVEVGGVKEVPAFGNKSVENFEGGLLAALTEVSFLGFAEVHGAETEG